MSKDKEKAMDRAMKSSLKKKSIQYESSMMKFSVQIRALNLRIRDVDADGNCLFRAVADQIEGNQQNHLKYRHAVVDYMQDNPDLFKPFIDQDFDNYLKKMKKSGCWGGHLELLAVAHAFNVDVVIHQLSAPRFELRNSLATISHPVDREIHLSYHDGEHYASVRAIDDSGKGPAARINIPSHPINSSDSLSLADKQEDIVMQLTKCENREYVRLMLRYNAYDTDATVESMLAEFHANGVFSYQEDEEKEKQVDDVVSVKDVEANLPEMKHVEHETKKKAVQAKVNQKIPVKLSNKERKELKKNEKKEKESESKKVKEKARTKPKSKKNDDDSLPDDFGSIAI